MDLLELIAIGAGVLALAIWAGLAGREKKPDEMEYIPPLPPEPPKPPPPEEVKPEPVPEPTPPPPPKPEPPAGLPGFATQAAAFKSTRMICDEMGIPTAKDRAVYLKGKLIGYFSLKDIICACIFQESEFQSYYLSGPKKGQPVKFENVKNGKVWSTDWGIVQINDTEGWHIGPGLPFKNVQEVLTSPEKCIRYMVRMAKIGKLSLWSSYKGNHYQQHLVPGSRMWKLRT